MAACAALLLCAACGSAPAAPTPAVAPTRGANSPLAAATAAPPQAAATRPAPMAPPTLDPPRNIPDSGVITTTYVVRAGDTLGGIALATDGSVDELQRMNGLVNPAAIRIGQTLLVTVKVNGRGPAIKLLPDSELVNGPAAAAFDLKAFVESQPGYLKSYTEMVDGRSMAGWEVVKRVSEQHSVHPRALLAALEYASAWVTDPAPAGDRLTAPIGTARAGQRLYLQLSWAAARLNEGYYGWRLGTRLFVRFPDGDRSFVGDRINAGTAAVQNYLAAVLPRDAWFRATTDSDGSFIRAYRALFGDAWQYDAGPPVPGNLQQPAFALPWALGQTWYLTGGPHSAWSVGTPWSSIDFASASTQGCAELSDWVTAIAAGPVVRSELGEVVQSLDAARDERVGWSVMYLHIAARDRAQAGAQLRVGDRIGHPSCEGGASSGAHLHIARKYNGEWLNAAGPIPFVMDGWTAFEGPSEYAGGLRKGGLTREACQCKELDKNGLTR